MTRLSYTINSDADRDSVAALVRTLKNGMRVDIKQPKRSDAQNAKFWAMLNEVADQVTWHDVNRRPIKLDAEDWKLIFIDALNREVRIVPGIDGKSFVNLSTSSSDLSVSEMADAITLIEMFGANHAVTFKESQAKATEGKAGMAGGDEAPVRRSTAGTGLQVGEASADLPATSEHMDVTDGRDRHPNSNSSDASSGSDLTNTPGAECLPRTEAPGVSLLSDDWRDTYVVALSGIRDKAASLLTRHSEAMQMLGGEPNERELAWMRMVWKLVHRRDTGRLKRGEFETEIEKIMASPLPAAEHGAAA